MNKSYHVEGVILDPINRKTIVGRIYVNNGIIERIEERKISTKNFILPGFVDSHIHIESSMLTPAEFSRIAIKHGTVAVVADPHEIANVAGVKGIDFMIRDAKRGKMKFFFGAPSCVPASPYDDCCQVLDSNKIEELLGRDDIYFLGEMMNFPGVIMKDSDVQKKIEAAKKQNKKIDGHAPGLSKENLVKYINAGISTDHECSSLKEAKEKIKLGMKVLIREGSAAKNFSNLHKLIKNNSANVMLCTDDCHPDDLIKGHINIKVKKALDLGYDIFDILQIASVNPIRHYGIKVGLLQEGDPADFIVINNLKELKVVSTYIDGEKIINEKINLKNQNNYKHVNYTFPTSISAKQIKLKNGGGKINTIKVVDGELLTEKELLTPKVEEGYIESDINRDLLKIVVVNRYKPKEISIGLIKGFGLKKGAISESIAHDSHHIIAVGCDDISILKSIEYVIENRGGICYFDGKNFLGLPLKAYGLMSFDSAEQVAKSYHRINSKIVSNGCKLKSPFMTLSFMALTVIPKLKISPRGLFDVEQFKFIELFSK